MASTTEGVGGGAGEGVGGGADVQVRLDIYTLHCGILLGSVHGGTSVHVLACQVHVLGLTGGHCHSPTTGGRQSQENHTSSP